MRALYNRKTSVWSLQTKAYECRRCPLIAIVAAILPFTFDTDCCHSNQASPTASLGECELEGLRLQFNWLLSPQTGDLLKAWFMPSDSLRSASFGFPLISFRLPCSAGQMWTPLICTQTSDFKNRNQRRLRTSYEERCHPRSRALRPPTTGWAPDSVHSSRPLLTVGCYRDY